jgi:hypothetical protein
VVTSLVAQLESQLAQQDKMAQMITPIVDGQVKQVVLGHDRRGRPILLNGRSLAMIDQIIAASSPASGRAASLRALDDAGGDDEAAIADNLESASSALDSLSSGDNSGSADSGGSAGAVDWYSGEAVASDGSSVEDTVTSDVVQGDTPQVIRVVQSEVDSSGFQQLEQQDDGVLQALDDGSDGSTLSAEATAAVGSFAAAQTVDEQVAQARPPAGGAPGIVNVISGTLITTTAGGQTSFSIKLNSQPAADVTVPLRLDNPSEAILSTGSLTFTPGDWNVPQTVTITGQPDPNNTGAVQFRVLVGPSVSDDPYYNDLNAQSVPVINKNINANVSGHWIGTEQTSASDGTAGPTFQITFDLTQNGNSVSGKDTWTYESGGQGSVTLQVSGTINGSTLQLSETAVLENSAGHDWSLTTFGVTVFGNTMSGTDQDVAGESGTEQLNRK